MPSYNDIIIKCALPLSDCIGGENIYVVDFSAAVIEGHKGIFSYSKEEIVIQLKKSQLKIIGSALKIVEINCDQIYISGAIVRVERVL